MAFNARLADRVARVSVELGHDTMRLQHIERREFSTAELAHMVLVWVFSHVAEIGLRTGEELVANIIVETQIVFPEIGQVMGVPSLLVFKIHTADTIERAFVFGICSPVLYKLFNRAKVDLALMADIVLLGVFRLML